MAVNWSFHHDDYSPFGSDEHILITEYRSLIITTCFFLIGICGNCIILIGNGYILRHSNDGEKRTFENFLVEISCFDLIVLCYHLINGIIRYKALPTSDPHTMTGLINISTVCCKLLTYIVRVSTLMSHWLIILLLINRLFLIYPKFYRLIAIVNAKYAVLGLLCIFTLFNVLPIESTSFDEPLILLSNATANITLSRHCLINAEMVNLEASIHSSTVIINVFFYTGIGLILPTIIICILSILIFQKGAHLWHELRSHHSASENISLRSKSPIAEYLRTYNAAFTLGIIFVLLSIPCKLLRLIVLFASNSIDESISSTHILLQAHTHMQTIGHAFELSLYSYKCFICICTHHRFRCALKYLLTYRRAHVLIDEYRPSVDSCYGNKDLTARASEESVPFEALYTHLQIDEFDTPITLYTSGMAAELYSHRSSFKTRASVSSRRTKEDEISL